MRFCQESPRGLHLRTDRPACFHCGRNLTGRSCVCVPAVSNQVEGLNAAASLTGANRDQIKTRLFGPAVVQPVQIGTKVNFFSPPTHAVKYVR